MLQLLLPTAIRPAETQRRGENGPAPLSRLHRPRDETPAVTDSFDMVEDRDLRVTGKHKVAVHAVDGEVGGDGSHGCGEGLSYRGAAVDAAGSWGMPEGTGIGEDILERVVSYFA